MTIFESILLGIVQGLAEFLPISSSGHLAILQHFFKIDSEKVLPFAVLLHVGTLISLVAVYYKDLWDLIKELGAMCKDIVQGRGPRLYANTTRKLGFLIIIATFPTAVIGLLFNDLFNNMYSSMLAVGICLIITGTLLWIAEKTVKQGKEIRGMRIRDAFLIGVFQGIAIAPGISRSGSTIVGGLFSGLSRELTVRFAFLISVPSILGAVILEGPSAFADGFSKELVLPILIGVVTAAIFGFLAIKTMIRLVSGKRLTVFSWYTWIIGAALLVYVLVTELM
ncbi:MAG TPA: undecaprenyl-diphosphate phosphatase [Clostridiales bacterium]|nr:undecaprenyl-diphosphate phosphatase [Clostridiales bacterium]